MRSQNHTAVIQLKLLGYPLVNIRKALHALTGITQTDMAPKIGVTRAAVTLTVNSFRGKKRIQEKVAEIFDVPVDELFEDKTQGKSDAATTEHTV